MHGTGGLTHDPLAHYLPRYHRCHCGLRAVPQAQHVALDRGLLAGADCKKCDGSDYITKSQDHSWLSSLLFMSARISALM